MKKYAFWVKCLTFVLCVVLLLGVAVSGLGVLLSESMSLYSYEDYMSWRYSRSENMAYTLADQVIMDYAGQQSGSPQWLLEQTGYVNLIEIGMSWYALSEEDWYYEVLDPNGKVVATTQKDLEDPLVFAFGGMYSNYPVIVTPAETPAMEATAAPEATEAPSVTAPRTEDVVDATPTLAPTEPVMVPATTYVENVYNPQEYYNIHYAPNSNEEVWVQYDELQNYQVNIGVEADHSSYYVTNGYPLELLEWLFSVRFYAIAAVAGSLLLFAAACTFMMIIAGKNPKTGEAVPKALNKLPLDIYLAVAVFATVLGGAGVIELLEIMFDNDGYHTNALIIVLLCACGIGVATLDMGFFTALAAQAKVPNHFWWKNSICGRILKWIWKYIRLAGKGIRKVLDMLPLVWEWLAIGAVLAVGTLTNCLISFEYGTGFPLFLWCLVGIAVISYGGWCYGTIRKGIRRMRDGDLDEKIDTQYMYGSFRTIAEELNALADVVAIAAAKQLKAERMKTELITNVSHDIKTPLTSVINYVDLLQQPHTEEEGQQYLEVLSRQSLRLKKLVEDLMDMSKASTGNMAVSIAQLDAVEAVNQALGEFAEKLENAKLTPVFRTPDRQLHMLADGKLTWRVLSNLLSNVVKYALPGTRVYIDLLRLNKSVVLSVKNISREELNISAEELTERFVRGDASRNTEGSGLGLNIAQSLMRLQRGDMELTVDGDLFKVTLTFPTE